VVAQKNKIKDPIGDQLSKIIELRGIPVPELAKVLGIPKFRIYKWVQGIASPKYEDRVKIIEWINNPAWNFVPPRNSSSGNINEAEEDYKEKYIKLMEDHRSLLQKLLINGPNSVTILGNQGGSIEALVEQIRESAYRESKGNPKIEEQILDGIRRKMLPKLGVDLKKNIPAGEGKKSK
jgi:transcriptional regulator with XRE-family HTH domain